MTEIKVCTCCGLPKPVAEFHRFGKDLARIGKWCEECYQKKKGSMRKAEARGRDEAPRSD